MGCILDKPFNNFCKQGFPTALINQFQQETGKQVLGNKEANGLKIIHELGQDHFNTHGLIVYTSIDSTFKSLPTKTSYP